MANNTAKCHFSHKSRQFLHKTRYKYEKSLDIIREGKGTHFDPLITDVFLMHEKEFSQRRVCFGSLNME